MALLKDIFFMKGLALFSTLSLQMNTMFFEKYLNTLNCSV